MDEDERARAWWFGALLIALDQHTDDIWGEREAVHDFYEAYQAGLREEPE